MIPYGIHVRAASNLIYNIEAQKNEAKTTLSMVYGSLQIWISEFVLRSCFFFVNIFVFHVVQTLKKKILL